MLRWPSLRRPLDVLYLVTCVVLTLFVLVPEIWGHGKTKDYPLWFWAGQQVLHGADLYPRGSHDVFAFIYPPLPAILLAIPSYFGKIPLYISLCIANSAAWWATSQLSNAMTGERRIPGPWLAALPAFVTITFVFDMFDLGQPNLVLLAFMLYGFWLLQRSHPSLAGALFALATAIKVFPVAVLPYLLWRKQWICAASMVVFVGVFLLVIPAPIRGFDRNVSELGTWYRGMVGSSSEEGFGQRNEQNWSWINQSVIAVTHRLLRPINYNQIEPNKPTRTMNIADLPYRTVNLIVVAVSALIGLGFVAILPRARRRTAKSDAEELAILFCLMTVASPLARQYYFVWLFFPMTVLMHRAAFDPRPHVRIGTWLTLAVAGGLMTLSLPIYPALLQAIGNNLFATGVLVAGLAWHIHHPPHVAEEVRPAMHPSASATIATAEAYGSAIESSSQGK